ncbi:predicted protein [Nematostella vectensis]|uniref:DRBM domain-containing protein n=1 Tax=Nematostella vectensis TaxID=45351 RepID=A7SPG0_NEMVE|nr:predicted protein [Nematostella vectensis]|eukprot:XP_001626500.1 predicted protein [Nematostella vectensis]
MGLTVPYLYIFRISLKNLAFVVEPPSKMSRLQNTSTSVMKQRVLKAVLVQVLMTKNPISALMEACAQAGLKVTFQEYDESLRGFDKIFTCDVTVDGVLSSCRAYGPTKKEAKGNAARKAIEELTFDPSLGNSSTYKMSQVSSESRISPLHPKTTPPKGPETVENYIGTLQEYTAAHRWPTPKYSEDMRGQDHCKEFIVKCNQELKLFRAITELWLNPNLAPIVILKVADCTRKLSCQ